jgi:hypothetical protein
MDEATQYAAESPVRGTPRLECLVLPDLQFSLLQEAKATPKPSTTTRPLPGPVLDLTESSLMFLIMAARQVQRNGLARSVELF